VNRYLVEATLLSPLVIRRERQSSRSDGAAQHVAGTLLRGAFARVYLDRFGKPDDTFRHVFQDEDACRFGPLDPADRVLPLSASSCKRQSGFIDDQKHGVVDRLLPLLRLPLAGRALSREHCPECPQDLKPFIGFWQVNQHGRPTSPKKKWRASVAAHVGIDRFTHTAEESILFNLPTLQPEPLGENDDEADPSAKGAIEPGPAGEQDGEKDRIPKLYGQIESDDKALGVLSDLLAEENGLLRIGHARTRGYGQIKLQIGTALAPQSTDWNAWSEFMLSQCMPGHCELANPFLFSLSLPTGGILVDRLLRYTADPSGMVPWLPQLPAANPSARTLDGPGKPFEDGRLRCVTAVATHDRLRGWNAAHGLPRDDEWSVARGAVYAYLYVGGADGRARLIERLGDLQQRGIGARRNEGFGRVLVCDDFHLQFAPVEAT
jgi:CRISPR-associated protein Csx10